jgi:hypothetical protein
MKALKEAGAEPDSSGSGTAAPIVARAFLTTAELQAQVLPLSRRSIYELRKKQIIPSVESGGKILFHRESVIAALVRHQTGGAS